MAAFAKAMKEAVDAINNIEQALKSADSAIDNSEQKVKTFGDRYKESLENVDKDFESAGESISSGLKTIGTAVVTAGTALVGLSAATSEYREGQAKLATAFETAGSNATVAKDTYNDLYRVLGDSDVAVEAAGHLAKLTTEEQALNEWTTICQGVYATFGDSLPIEGLTEAANETAKVGTLTGVLADALNWAGVNEEDFQAKLDGCNTEAEREALIRETLNGLYSDAAANYEANNAEIIAQNEAQIALNDSTAALGEAMSPLVTMLTDLGTSVLTAITPHLQSFAENYLPTIKELLTGVGETLSNMINWISEHSTLLTVLAAVIGTVVAAIMLYNIHAGIKAAMAAAEVTSVWGLVAAYAAHAAAVIVAIAPYVLIVAAIAAVIAIIVLCVKHWDEIKEAISNAWETIKEKTSAAVEAVSQWFSDMKEKISNKVEEIKTAMSEKWASIKQTISDKVAEAKETVSSKFNEIKSSISNTIESAKSAVTSKFESIKSTISNKISSIKTSVTTGFTTIKTNITDKVTGAYNTVKDKFEAIKTKVSSVMESAKTTVKNAVEKLKGFFDFDWQLPKIKLPHFTITGSFSLNPPSIPKFSVSWYQMGGVFDSKTLFPYGVGSIGGLGENGAEAVVPLEKNTYWLDRLATMLAEKQGNTPVILQVDGKTFAKTSIATINQLTRQTGKLELNII